MMSEFLVMSLPAFTLFVERYFKKFHLDKALGVLWIFLLLYCSSRSAWIGLALWIVFQIWSKSWSRLKPAALAIVLFVAVPFLFQKDYQSEVALVKSNSLSQRSEIYQAPWNLIAENPFGVGPGHYAQAISPYLIFTPTKLLESVRLEQPHSKVLKWFAELGWLGGLLALATLLTLVYSIRELPPARQNFFISVVCVIAPQLAFQFPTETPSSVLLLAAYLGFYLDSFKTKRVTLPTSKLTRFGFAAVAVAFVFLSVSFFTSMYISSNYTKDLTLNKWACELSPLNIRACVQRNNLSLGESQDVLKSYFRANGQIFSFHVLYLRFLINFFSTTNQVIPTCQAINIYDNLVAKQIAFRDEAIRACKAVETPVNFSSPAAFKKSYEEWLESSLR